MYRCRPDGAGKAEPSGLAAISEAAHRRVASSGLCIQREGSFDNWKHEHFKLESARHNRTQRSDKAKLRSTKRSAMQENYLPSPPFFCGP